jgi:hypothetical protein
VIPEPHPNCRCILPSGLSCGELAGAPGCLLPPDHGGPCVSDMRAHPPAGYGSRPYEEALGRGLWDGIPEETLRAVADNMTATIQRKLDEALLGPHVRPETGSPPPRRRRRP